MNKIIYGCFAIFVLLVSNQLNAQTITAAEYFFDTDPGQGKATPISITPGGSINITTGIPTTGLTEGFHQLFFRFKDDQNRWGLAEQRSLFIQKSLNDIKPTPLTAAEYFYGDDPGQGKGSSVPVIKTDSLNTTTNIILPDFPVGNKPLSIRVKDSTGKWSIAESRVVEVVCKPRLGNDTTVNICNGIPIDITNLYDYKHYASFQWNTANPTAVTAGNYRLVATSSLGCSDTAIVSVREFASPTISAGGPTSFCQGGSVKLTASAGNTFLWSNGASTKSITVNSAGSYSVMVTNAAGCVKTSMATIVTVNPIPTITANGSTNNVCPGQTVTLTSSSATSYLWSTGATTQSIVAGVAGSYTVTTGAGCTSDITIVTYQACAQPGSLATNNITATGARVSWAAVPCAVGYQYQWRKKGTSAWTSATTTGTNKPVTGLSTSTTYQWRVITGCKTTPDTISSGYVSGPEFTTLAAAASPAINIQQQINSKGNLTVKLSPNPAHDHATLQLSGDTKTMTIRLTDMAGKTLWESRNVNSTLIQIPVSKFSSGTYLLVITTGTERRLLKLVKE